MANEKTPVVWDDTAKKHRPLGSGEKMGGLSASSMISTDSGNLLQQGSDGLMLVTGSSLADPRADNLLEESANGKLQVTTERVVEWLDGHPQAAAAIADAVKVVSGDSGNVIAAGTDKGAYMSSATLASALAGMSTAQLQQLASTLADGKTVVASGGRLTVDPTSATAAQLTKISSAIRKSGGGLSVGSDGKLSVDFASMDPAIMRGVVLSMVQQGGGIAVDSSGKLYVDFDSMPTDKFEALLKSLKMQIPLEANLSLYVDVVNGSDTIVDGRGSESTPFKTIGACASWAAGYYSLGQYNITIYVRPGTYNESVVLPQYNASSGVFIIRASDYSNPPIISRSDGLTSCIRAIGGVWQLFRLKLVNHPVDPGGSTGRYLYCVSAGGSADVTVCGCDLEMEYSGDASDIVHMDMAYASSGGFLRFTPIATYPTTFVYDAGSAAHLRVLSAELSGSIVFNGPQDPNRERTMPCRGAATVFAYCTNSSSITVSGSVPYRPYFTVGVGGSCTGTKYAVLYGSDITAPSGGFPGDANGSVESETYCWYKQMS